MTVESTQALGPFRRYGVWVQGCQKHCPGCISEDSQPIDGGYEVPVPDLAHDILNTVGIEGITISGGEPFLQSDALVELIAQIRAEKDLGIIIYTGMRFDEIEDNSLTQICDMIIDGEYHEDLNDDLSLRGSSNQKIHLISQRYTDEIGLYGKKGRKIELRFLGDKTTMVGIPDKESLGLLEASNGGLMPGM